MKKGFHFVALVVALLSVSQGFVLAEDAPVKLVPVLKINKEIDKRTAIKPSTIPNAGNGLFAVVPIGGGDRRVGRPPDDPRRLDREQSLSRFDTRVCLGTNQTLPISQ